MARPSRFHPGRQLAAFRRLVDQGFITDLRFKKSSSSGAITWNFRMGMVTFHTHAGAEECDFSNYCLKVRYTPHHAPRVYVTEPVLPETTKHLYKDASLCLYKEKNWQWRDDMQFDEDLFSTVCGWIYYHEKFLETGHWHGEEAAHDLPEPIYQRFLKLMSYENK